MSKKTVDPYILACKKLGIEPLSPLADRTNKDLVAADAFYRLTICIRAKNVIGGVVWIPVYDGSEWHYYPRWKRHPSGFGVSFTFYDCWSTRSSVGSRLEYRTRKLMNEGVKEFDVYYQDYFNQ